MNRSKQASMGRKIIILLLVTMALAPVHLVEAQQAKKVPLVGILTPDPVSARINLFEAFKKGLRGWLRRGSEHRH